MKKFFVFVISLFLFVQAAFAAEVNVTIDGEEFFGGRLIGSVTYVPIRAFSEELAGCDVQWLAYERKAVVEGENISASAKIGESYLESKGRVIYSGNSNVIIDGSAYVPVRSLAGTLGASVSWNNTTRTAEVKSESEEFKSADDFYNANDLYWLAKIISAESAGESLAGKIAVGNVVMNRVKNPDFPDNIYDVIHDNKGGVQFTPVANGAINNYPTEESFIAAKICLEDYKLTDENILFFLNPAISTSTWVPQNRDFVMSIGRHDFYA